MNSHRQTRRLCFSLFFSSWPKPKLPLAANVSAPTRRVLQWKHLNLVIEVGSRNAISFLVHLAHVHQHEEIIRCLGKFNCVAVAIRPCAMVCIN